MEDKFYIRVICTNKVGYDTECRNELLTSKPMTQQEIKDRWINLVMTKGFNTPRCDKCKYSTFSDLNIGTDMQICKVGSKRALNSKKFLS